MEEKNVRKLKTEEHIRTRRLWEKIFTEDTPEFLDYYYSEKVRDNEIYVIEDNDEIVSMLHLNPYLMRIGEQIYQTHYIVAVATDERYRRKGYMATLLNYAMKVMKERGEPFTFLMPASEAIYKPFGFEFIYEQYRTKITGLQSKDASLEVVRASLEDCKEIASFANEFLKDYGVVTWRTEDYYQTLLKEQASENGGILLLKRNGSLAGVVCYAKGEEIEIREPLVFHKEDLQYAIYSLTGNETQNVLCTGYGKEETKPMIMANVFAKEVTKDLKKQKVFINEVV